MALPETVHDLSLSVPFGDTNIQIHPVAVETDHGLILVDAAVPDALGDIEAQLDAFDYSVEDVTLVVVTHHDADHVAGLAQVVERSGALVCAHQTEVPYLAGRTDPVKGNWAPDPVPVDVELVDGVTFRTDAGPMDVVATPGHSPGHCSLYFPTERILVSADALNVVDDRLVGPKSDFTPDMETAIESVAKLATLDIATTHCYHGGTIEEGTRRITAIRDSLR